jgi:hypothetical protein
MSLHIASIKPASLIDGDTDNEIIEGVHTYSFLQVCICCGRGDSVSVVEGKSKGKQIKVGQLGASSSKWREITAKWRLKDTPKDTFISFHVYNKSFHLHHQIRASVLFCCQPHQHHGDDGS